MRVPLNHWLIKKPVAHRGLWGGDVIENSLTAYKRAVDNGYPIEIDLYLTTDNEIVSFHDRTLDRMTGAHGFVFDKSLAFLKELSLQNSNERIPTLDEVLNVVDGKVPLLIEIKNQPNKKIVDLMVNKLKYYHGEFAIQSFNPFYLMRVKKLAPEFLRGVLGNGNAFDEKFIKRKIVKNMPFNFLIKPDFISYLHSNLPLKKRKVKNKIVLAWTITDKNMEINAKKFADNIIFEHYIP